MLALLTGDCPSSEPDLVIEHQGSCYKFRPGDLSWENSQIQCKDEGGRLATIINKELQEKLYNKAVENDIRNLIDATNYWIGAKVSSAGIIEWDQGIHVHVLAKV